jgi:hypothetical protein
MVDTATLATPKRVPDSKFYLLQASAKKSVQTL